MELAVDSSVVVIGLVDHDGDIRPCGFVRNSRIHSIVSENGELCNIQKVNLLLGKVDISVAVIDGNRVGRGQVEVVEGQHQPEYWNPFHLDITRTYWLYLWLVNT